MNSAAGRPCDRLNNLRLLPIRASDGGIAGALGPPVRHVGFIIGSGVTNLDPPLSLSLSVYRRAGFGWKRATRKEQRYRIDGSYIGQTEHPIRSA